MAILARIFGCLAHPVLLSLLLMSAPAWAKGSLPGNRGPLDFSHATVDEVPVALGSEANMLRSIEASPDVVVFPVWLAGPVHARTSIANSIAAAGSGSIAVIYPDIVEPYRSVFTQIISGIKDKAGSRVNDYAVSASVDVGEVNNSLRRQDTRVVIALGRQGARVASGLDSNIDVVLGGVLSATESEVRDHPVNSLSPDPALLFSRLKGLMPRVKRVFTVYDPRQSAWMMRLAKEAARAQGLEFTAVEAQDLRSAILAYQKLIAGIDSNQDALWLPQDSTTVEDSTVLPMVLQESWSRNLTVFSSSFAHVKRGVLFSLYPNNVELGRHLAGSALGFLTASGKETSGMFPLREVLMAINLRTARHLEINATRQQGFDVAFPEQ